MLWEKENYKCLWIFDGNTVKLTEIKDKVKEKYSIRTSKQVEIKLYSSNLVVWKIKLLNPSESFLINNSELINKKTWLFQLFTE